jgi:hypothetical protein
MVSALSVEFESDLRSIYSRSRTIDEVTREIAALRDKIADRRDAFEKEYERTSQIIEARPPRPPRQSLAHSPVRAARTQAASPRHAAPRPFHASESTFGSRLEARRRLKSQAVEITRLLS